MKAPSHSLELNLMLAFVFMASRKLGVLEKDVLLAARNDTIGYLTEYKRYEHLKQAHYKLRPINVPSKNKWLRETAGNLVKHDSLLVSECDHSILIARVGKELLIAGKITQIASSILQRAERKLPKASLS